MLARAPRFWSERGGLGALLAPVGALVGAVTLRRMARPGVAAPVCVICVGNPTVGGAGKTPTALALLAHLAGRGAHPFALLRGHGGREAGPLLVDPARHDAADVGDEALLLARAAPTVVARDRPAGAALAAGLGATHVVMDDGFQNPSLVKDASVLVVDGAVGFGNGRVLPAGPLRAPFPAQAARADAILVIGGTTAAMALSGAWENLPPVLTGALVPDAKVLSGLSGRRLLAFAGIGRPEKFFATLVAAGLDVARTRSFPDHHPYDSAEIADLYAEARRDGLLPVTTEKDAVRLCGIDLAPPAPAIAVLPVRLALDDGNGEGDGFEHLVTQAEARYAARRQPV